jgi:hypothetical protein
MAVVQDVYNAAPAKGFAGQVTNGETSNRISRTVSPADVAGIAFGQFAWDLAVASAANDHLCTLTPTANKCLGPAIANHGQQSVLGVTGAPAGAVGADIYGPRSTAGICTEGRIYVPAAVAVAKDDDVYVTPAGLVTNVANAGANIKATTPAGRSWKFDETTAGADLAAVVLR